MALHRRFRPVFKKYAPHGTARFAKPLQGPFSLVAKHPQKHKNRPEIGRFSHFNPGAEMHLFSLFSASKSPEKWLYDAICRKKQLFAGSFGSRSHSSCSFTAVDNLSLTVNAGEIMGFIGHNGAGKTTTLRAVAGILDFTEGEIVIDGHSVKDEPVAAKQVTAFLPDNPDLYEFLTGIKYLAFIADIYGISKDVREERIRKYADAFELTGALGSPIGGYSHGMKQKLAVISALIRAPRLLILDEPFVGLDPQAAFVLKGFLREICAAGGAVFFSTHVLEVAEKLCDRIAIIKGGRLVKMGTTASVVGDESLEQVFLELAQEGGAHA